MSDPSGAIHVLHIDDDPSVCDLVASFLERHDDRLDVTTMTDPTAVLDRLETAAFDCLVSDYDMPRRNGLELLDDVENVTPEVPFILFTGKGSEEIAARAIRSGVTDYIQKEGHETYTVLANRVIHAAEQYRTERDARRTRRRLEEITEKTNDLLWMYAGDWEELLFVNSVYEELYGQSIDALRAEPTAFLERIHSADRESVEAFMDRVSSGESADIEYRIRDDEGDTRWLWVQAEPIVEDGSVERIVGFSRDITDRTERERELSDEQEFVGQALDTLDDVFYYIGPNGEMRRWNDALVDVSGYSAAEIEGMNAAEFFPPDERDRIGEAIATTIETGSVSVTAEFRTKAGERIPYEFTGSRVDGDDGSVRGLVGIGRNLADRREKERRFEAVFDDPNLLVGLLSPDGTVLDVNATAMEYVDEPFNAVVDEPFEETPWWDDGGKGTPSDVRAWIDRAASGEYVEFDAEHVAPDGNTYVVTGVFRPVTDAGGAVTSIVVSTRDVTAFRESKRQLERQHQRMSEFASVLSHDLQTPMATARGRLELALDTGELSHVESALDATKRADELRMDVAETLRTGEITIEDTELDLAALARSVWSLFSDTERECLHVEGSPCVRGDREAVRRLFENLFSNAIEHGAAGCGLPTVRLGATDRGVYVEDDGPGIDPEVREEIFTAGFSTKGGSEGTGLGMTSVRQIVDAHGWEIVVGDAEELGGARIEIVTRSER
jgi:PAS domain S-box-containing protein